MPLSRIETKKTAGKSALAILLVSTILVLLTSSVSAVTSLNCDAYTATPPFLASDVKPSTHIIFDNSGSMHEFAYQERKVWLNRPSWYDSHPYAFAGFNATQNYYGYFDPEAYYSYNSTGEFFYKDTSNSNWNGNFLNWASMHRIDVSRKVLTGGKYEVANGHVLLNVEYPDGISRGSLKVFDDSAQKTDLKGNTKFMTNNHNQKIVIDLFSDSSTGDVNMRISSVSSVDNQGAGCDEDGTYESGEELWYEDSTLDTYRMRIKVDSTPAGVLDGMSDLMRFSLFIFDDGGDVHNGGDIIRYMGVNATEIKDKVNNVYPKTWTPLAETFHTVSGYIQQDDTSGDTGPIYESDSYTVDDGSHSNPDPFYFKDMDELIHCTKQNVILITDGESTHDQDVPDTYKDYDGDGNDPGNYTNNGTDHLDDLALWAHTNDLRSDLTGNQTVNLYTIFAFGEGGGSQLLKDAAKNGGFVDKNDNGKPDQSSEYDQDGDGVPDHYFQAGSGRQLESAIVSAFSQIMSRMSSGSAASVISSSRKGAGAIYQAVFWPSKSDPSGNKVEWVGDVHAFLSDAKGRLYEDNGAEENTVDSGDNRIRIFYDESEGRSRVCTGGGVENGTCNGTVKDFNEIEYLWSATDWLNSPVLDPLENRTNYMGTTFDNNRRYLFTWIDEDNDSNVDGGEQKAFDSDVIDAPYVGDDVIDWVRGVEKSGMRNRTIDIDTNNDGTLDETSKWRMGDVVHSTPTVVGPPRENYDLYWGETSYTEFYKKYKNRRYVAYFGGNDGMLHAVNSGFYSSAEDKFYEDYSSGSYSDDSSAPELGAELWGYVPYNLLPHLECLTDPNYEHQYFVDMEPRVFDVQIFEEDDDHPNGWGTILVCGMRFGGSGIPKEFANNRFFGSSYFILDVTNPEKPPELLGEVRYDGAGSLELGYTITAPTVVPVRSGGELSWFLTLGTGPNYLSGASETKPKVAVIPLEQIVDSDNEANPNFDWYLPGCSSCAPSPTSAGYLEIPAQNGAIGTNFAAVDYDFDLFSDIFYFGTVEKKKNKDTWNGGLWSLKVEGDADPSNWAVKERVDTGRPVTATPNIGFYNEHAWIYFGTGKFWTVSDKTDQDTQQFYGVQDPKFTGDSYNFNTVSKSNLVDVSDILVEKDTGALSCTGGGTYCFPEDDIDTFSKLEDYMGDKSNVDGWYRDLKATGERVIGQATLLGGLVSFTSYTPNADVCQAEGSSKLYAVYYVTGTPWTENVFGTQTSDDDYVEFTRDLGTGMSATPSLHMGSEEGTKAIIQTSTGEIVEINQPNLPLENVHSGKSGWHTD